MSTQATALRPAPLTTSSARQATIVGSIFGFLGAISVFAWSALHWDDSSREVVTGAGAIAGCVIAAAGAALLLIALPRILEGLATWAIIATVLGLVFTVADAWYAGTVAVGVANEIDDATYNVIFESAYTLLFSLPKMLLCCAGLIGLAVSGWRTGLVSRPLAILLAVAGVASLVPPFMPGLLVASIAFLLLARAQANR